MKKVYQVELWQECNNHCKYCYNQKTYFPQSSEFKIKNIRDVIKTIQSEDFFDNSIVWV